jgi:N-acetylneuraminate synthase/N,N'-diacetyllegionaminate synthase
MVDAIRNIELAISGHGRKEPSPSELPNKEVARKSLHLASSLSKGTVIEESHLIALRPGDGISPMQWNRIIRRRLNKNLETGAKLSWADLG